MKVSILGIDEVGRGPWAGPLVVGACILPTEGGGFEGLTDSKKLTAKKREQLATEIRERATVGLGWVSAPELDAIGLSAALKKACRVAVKAVQQECARTGARFNKIVIDGTVNFLSDTALSPNVAVIKKADLSVPAVSAASVVAKTARDRYMRETVAVKYPGYGFENHVGYGTAEHRVALERLGLCPEHRRSFRPVKAIAERENATQNSVAKNGMEKSNATKNGVAKSGTAKTSKTIGDRAETAVAEWLKTRGHKIVARNWRTRYCEIDIVSEKGRCLYFTEVKYRRNANCGDGLAAIDAKKLQQMRFATELFLAKNKAVANEHEVRLMVASVGGAQFKIEAWTTAD